MARIARIVFPRLPHLVAQRGNRSERLFYSTADRRRYLEILWQCLGEFGVKLWAYRLEAQQVLLVVVPRDEDGLARALRSAHGRYSQLVNRRQGTTGHLFQGRFYSCPMDQTYLALAVRHLERFSGPAPPETASSAAAHMNLKSARRRPGARGSAGGEEGDLAGILADDLPLIRTVRNWRAWLAQPADRAALDHLLSRLRVGKPAGSPALLRRAERLTGLNLSRPRGRPRKRPR